MLQKEKLFVNNHQLYEHFRSEIYGKSRHYYSCTPAINIVDIVQRTDGQLDRELLPETSRHLLTLFEDDDIATYDTTYLILQVILHFFLYEAIAL